MRSPARQHFIRHRAAATKAAADGARLREDLSQYELHLAQLAEHKRRLKQVQSIQRKIEYKRKVLPEYAAYIDGVLEADTGEPDDVVTTIMVWRIDTGAIGQALDIASYVLRHKLALPDQYERDAATVVTEEIAEQALATLAAKPDFATAAYQLGNLITTRDLVHEHDMPDQVSAKLHKALGYALRATDQPQEAVAELRAALAFDGHAGVKKDIERLEREIKNNPAKSSPPSPETSGDAAGNHSQSAKEAD